MSARTPRYALTEEHELEHDAQRAVAKVLRMELAREAHVSEHGVVWFSIDMANVADAVPAIRMARGIPAGVPDVLVLHQGRAFWIEMKSRNGEVSDPQRSMAASLLLSGCRIGVACNWQDVLGCLDTWGVPRKRRVRVAA